MAWMAATLPVSCLAQSWMIPQLCAGHHILSLRGLPYLTSICQATSTTPIGWTPGDLSSATNLHVVKTGDPLVLQSWFINVMQVVLVHCKGLLTGS